MESARQNELERRQSRSHRHRISRERACLVDGPERRNLFHDVAPAAEGAHRQPATDHLAERREIRRDAEARLSPTEGDAESGHYLVEHEQRAAARAVLAQRLEKPGPRQHQVHVSRHRFDDHRGDFLAAAAKGFFDLRAVVVVEHQRVRGGLRRDAGRTRVAEGERARARLDEQRIGVTVVAAFELDDQVAPGEPARQAQRAHRRFRTGRHQPHEFDRRHERAEHLGHLDFGFGRCAEGERPAGRRLHRFHHERMRVARDHRAPGADVVDVPPAVGVPEVGARGPLEERRHAADRAKRAHRGIDAGRNAQLGAGKKAFVA